LCTTCTDPVEGVDPKLPEAADVVLVAGAPNELGAPKPVAGEGLAAVSPVDVEVNAFDAPNVLDGGN
jgi:hypothetical protein